MKGIPGNFQVIYGCLLREKRGGIINSKPLQGVATHTT
jgi:hypothetical protein